MFTEKLWDNRKKKEIYPKVQRIAHDMQKKKYALWQQISFLRFKDQSVHHTSASKIMVIFSLSHVLELFFHIKEELF